MAYLSIIRRRSPSLLLSLFLAVLFSSPVHAEAVIELDKRLTWDLVGLDSNDVSSGPNIFPVGYRYCNSGDTAATNVVGTFNWNDTNSAYITLETGTSATINLAELGPGLCHDFYFNIQITRHDDAREKTRPYHIAVAADDILPVETPSYNQIFVESLVSQNRNEIEDIIALNGPTTVYLGETYQYVLYGSTATNGYEQLEAYIDFSNTIFRVLSVDATYTAPAPVGTATNDAVYADACGWVHDPGHPDYNSCTGTDKIGGDIIMTYEVEIIGTGSATMSAMIYDMSGSSYHYNKDYGTKTITTTALPPVGPALTIDKMITAGNSYAAVGDIIDYRYLVSNSGNVLLAGPVTVADDKTTATCPPVSTVGNNDNNLDPGESIICTASYSVVQTDLDQCSVTNFASASAGGTTSLIDIERATCNTAPPPTGPALIIDKMITAGAPYRAVGDIIDYSFLVTNSGNVLLEGPVIVADDKATAACPAVNSVGNLDGNLDPGESIICTASYSVVQEDLDSCEVTNIASAFADGIFSPTDSETATCSKKFPWPIFLPIFIPPPCPDEPLYCYAVSDRDNETSAGEGSTNSALLKYTFGENKLELVGRLGVGSVETMTLSLDGSTLYGVDSHRFGTIDTTPGNTASFTPVNPNGLGTGNGALGKATFSDIDSLSFDPSTGILYGTNRLASSDLLLQINPATGTFVKNAFGLGVDYVIIGNNAEAAAWFDLDDIGIDEDGTMYGIANAYGYNDRLVTIDKKTGNITNPVLMTVNGAPLNDVEGFSYYGRDTFYGTTGVETIGERGAFKNSLYKIEMNPVRVEKIIKLDQSFDGYRPYDFEGLACRICRSRN